MLMVNQLIGFGVVSGSTANPSYANPGGTGNRAGIITASAVAAIDFGTIGTTIDGNTSDGSGFAYTGSQSVSGLVMMKFDFGAAASKVINEIKIYRHSGSAGGLIGDAKAQGSNDDSSWFDVGTSITLGGTSDLTDTSLSANVTGYRYYRYLGVSGTTAAASRSVIDEVEFKIDNA